MPASWMSSAVSGFGEAAIRSPTEGLLEAFGKQLGLVVVPHDKARDTERGVRPDYAISKLIRATF
jgi:hypothetical protein